MEKIDRLFFISCHYLFIFYFIPIFFFELVSILSKSHNFATCYITVHSYVGTNMGFFIRPKQTQLNMVLDRAKEIGSHME